MQKQYVIPIFVPHLGCPNDCIFCNQKTISGEQKQVTKEDVANTVEYYLSSFKEENAYIEIAFFGGSFTGIEIEKQEALLKAAFEFVKAKKVCKVDNIGYIYLQRKGSITRKKDEKILDMLWAYKEIKMFLLDENAWNEYEMEFCIAVEYFKKFFLNILRECSTIFIIKNYR